jgi:hypothetical protein
MNRPGFWEPYLEGAGNFVGLGWPRSGRRLIKAEVNILINLVILYSIGLPVAVPSQGIGSFSMEVIEMIRQV